MNIPKNKIFNDVFLNLLSSLVLTGTLQLFVYPILALKASSIGFGNILTIMGICNIIGVMFGVSLNNVLLIKIQDYNINILKSSFSILLVISSFSIIVLSLFLNFFPSINSVDTFFLTVYNILIMLRSFLTVFFRIELNYKRIFVHSLFTSLGYFIGIVVYYFQVTDWVLVFLVGEIFSFIYLIFNIRYRKYISTKLYLNKEIAADFLYFFISTGLANLLLYLDRLLINPVLGANTVSIFFAASVVGKLLSLVIQPLSSVILSYLSKTGTKSSRKIFKKSLVSITIVGILFYIISLFITPLIIRYLYSDLYISAKSIYYLCNIIAIISSFSIILQPLSLKYCPTYWQSVIQIVYLVSYVSLSMYLMFNFGLIGFIFGNILSSIIKLVMVISLLNYYTAKGENNEYYSV